ncbi:TPA: DNA methyltransferase [Yersinia enterocolitica]|uniref:DNA methyltransferase n=1 Tax=Hafnia alvei TaxID=569 RepID=UPI0028BE3491|nr:DNA methyltransferase [Hafnia alvei]WNN51980.1 DNA methyltransferase [Hafnia alvei]HED0391807.1 site-specific DNA-methyltransferase [Yersinia enterocolitica]
MNAIAQELLDINKKIRSNLFKWNGQFSPQFIEALLKNYSKSGDTVLDPFSGSGTVLYEASKLNLNTIGCDINPSACKISNIYKLSNFGYQSRKAIVDGFSSLIKPILNNIPEENISEYTNEIIEVIDFNNEYLKILIEGYLILSDVHPYNKSKNNLVKLFQEYIQVILELPFNSNGVECYQADCRHLPLDNNTVNLVITSPPYINVFNYHQQYRKNVEALGYDVLKIAKSEIGSNRKFRSNRFFTVFQYIFDISKCLEEISRVSKDEAKIIFIVGKVSNILGMKINNGEIVKDIAVAMGFTIPFIQERSFKNKFGKIITEEIINIQNTKIHTHTSNALEAIGRLHLSRVSKEIQDGNVKELIMKAIDNSENIPLSPIYS